MEKSRRLREVRVLPDRVRRPLRNVRNGQRVIEGSGRFFFQFFQERLVERAKLHQAQARVQIEDALENGRKAEISKDTDRAADENGHADRDHLHQIGSAAHRRRGDKAEKTETYDDRRRRKQDAHTARKRLDQEDHQGAHTDVYDQRHNLQRKLFEHELRRIIEKQNHTRQNDGNARKVGGQRRMLIEIRAEKKGQERKRHRVGMIEMHTSDRGDRFDHQNTVNQNDRNVIPFIDHTHNQIVGSEKRKDNDPASDHRKEIERYAVHRAERRDDADENGGQHDERQKRNDEKQRFAFGTHLFLQSNLRALIRAQTTNPTVALPYSIALYTRYCPSFFVRRSRRPS